MPFSDPGIIQKIEGALQKLDDANDKLCDFYVTLPTSDPNYTDITRALQHIAEAKLDASKTLPLVP